MIEAALPESVRRLLWDVDVDRIDADRDAEFILERVMSRGTWDAMKWLRARYPVEVVRAFVRERGPSRLAPRDLAYWALIYDVAVPAQEGGGRPNWAGPQ